MNEWEFPKATIELHLSLKHIRSQMENPDTKQEAEAELQQFMNSFFGQSMRQEDVDLLADVLCGINGVIAGKVGHALLYINIEDSLYLCSFSTLEWKVSAHTSRVFHHH